MSSTAIQQRVTSTIIECLKKGTRPWRKPWVGGPGGPTNVRSKKPYNGINLMLLAIHNAAHNLEGSVYGTLKAWNEVGCRVKKRPEGVAQGSWGCEVVFYTQFNKKEVDENGEEKVSRLPVLRSYTVFAADQVEGGEAYMGVDPQPLFDPIEEAEALVKKTGATIAHGGDKAFYSPSTDHIQMPNPTNFKGATPYYGVLLHELVHWTGAEHRLDRHQKLKRFGDAAYAMEELVAEIGSCMLSTHLNLPNVDMENHSSYVDHWLKVLQKDHTAIFTAGGRANDAVKFIGVCEEVATE